MNLGTEKSASQTVLVGYLQACGVSVRSGHRVDVPHQVQGHAPLDGAETAQCVGRAIHQGDGGDQRQQDHAQVGVVGQHPVTQRQPKKHRHQQQHGREHRTGQCTDSQRETDGSQQQQFADPRINDHGGDDEPDHGHGSGQDQRCPARANAAPANSVQSSHRRRVTQATSAPATSTTPIGSACVLRSVATADWTSVAVVESTPCNQQCRSAAAQTICASVVLEIDGATKLPCRRGYRSRRGPSRDVRASGTSGRPTSPAR